LRNRFYIGEVKYKVKSCPEATSVMDRQLSLQFSETADQWSPTVTPNQIRHL
jgi:hypothetical protein